MSFCGTPTPGILTSSLSNHLYIYYILEMVPPVRWYYILSTWIFIASILYPLHQISTFPLNLLASVGCLEIVLNPHNESWVKNLYIIFIHIAPFAWIPYTLTAQTFQFAGGLILAYLLLIAVLGENPFHVYYVLLQENHKTAQQFLCDRYGICW